MAALALVSHFLTFCFRVFSLFFQVAIDSSRRNAEHSGCKILVATRMLQGDLDSLPLEFAQAACRS